MHFPASHPTIESRIWIYFSLDSSSKNLVHMLAISTNRLLAFRGSFLSLWHIITAQI